MSYSPNDLGLMQIFASKKFKSLANKWNINRCMRKYSVEKMIETLILSSLLESKSTRDVAQSFKIPKSTLCDYMKNKSALFF